MIKCSCQQENQHTYTNNIAGGFLTIPGRSVFALPLFFFSCAFRIAEAACEINAALSRREV